MNSLRTLHRTFLAGLLAIMLIGTANAQVLNLATNADPTLNPWSPGAVIESNLINTILFDQLTRYSPEDLTPIPALATAWEASADGLAWPF